MKNDTLQGKKILLYTHELTYTGSLFSLLRICRLLQKHGCEVEVWSRKEGTFQNEFENAAIPVKIIPEADVFRYAAEINKFDLGIANTVLSYRFYDECRKYIPVIWFVREAQNLESVFKKNSYCRKIFSRAEEVYCVSEYAAEFIGEHYNPDVKILHNCVEDFYNIENKKEKTEFPISILMLGSLTYRKAFDIAVDAFLALPQDYQNRLEIHFAGQVIGNNYEGKYVKSLLNKIQGSDHIKYLGEITDKEKIISLYEAADVVLVPSRDESCSLVVLEGAMQAKPLIVSENVGAKYLIDEENGWIFPTENKEALAEIFEHIADHSEKLIEMGEISRQKYEKMADMDTYEKKICELVEKKISKKLTNYAKVKNHMVSYGLLNEKAGQYEKEIEKKDKTIAELKQKIRELSVDIKVSIIMPVHDTVEHLERSVSSVLAQTLQEIELICVDDFSQDASLVMLKQFAEADPRIRVYSYNENRSAFQARKDGIRYAQGKYIMFLDADDDLEPTACEKLYEEMESRKVDILHFNSNIKGFKVTQTRINNMEKFVKPLLKKLKGKQVFKACFINDLYKFNLWNKIYSASVCKRAVMAVEDGYYPKANDLLLYFLIAVYAKSYEGIDSEAFYNYCFGLGSTGSSNLSLEKFGIYCYEAKTAQVLYEFVNNRSLDPMYMEAVKKLKKKLLDECIWNWNENLSENYAVQGYEILQDMWGIEDTIAGFARRLRNKSDDISRKLLHYSGFAVTKKSVKKIGIFYYRMAKGGVQRVISLLVPMYIKMGYEIVLFTEEIDEENEYELPENIRRVILPSSINQNADEYGERVREFRQALVENDVDMVMYHAAASKMLLFDIMTVKSLGIPFVMTVHELFSQSMVNLSTFICQRIWIYQWVDKLVVLSSTEETFWKLFGVNAVYLQNPIDTFERKPYDGQYILWIGRLEERQKRYMDAVEIMRLVVQEFPNEKMKIVGNEVTPGALEAIRKKVEEYDLQNNVEICGFQKDVSEYYQGAKLHLLTSMYEAFPMTVIESKSYGIPLVTYDMPYLELLNGYKNSYIAVEQKNVRQAAEKVISLLKKPEKLCDMSELAYKSIRNFANKDLTKSWEQIIASIEQGEKNQKKSKDNATSLYRNIVLTMLLHYEDGVEANNKKIKKLQQERKAQEEAKVAHWKELQVLKKEKKERWEELQAVKKERDEYKVIAENCKQEFSEMASKTNSNRWARKILKNIN